MSSAPQPTLTCSGRPWWDVEWQSIAGEARSSAFMVEIKAVDREAAKKAKRRARHRRRMAQANLAARRRYAAEADRFGRWSIAGISKVKLGARRQIWIKVRWEGADLQGRPWANSWEKVSAKDQSADVRRDARRYANRKFPSKAAAKRAWSWWDDSFHAAAERHQGGVGPSSRTRTGAGRAVRLRKTDGRLVEGWKVREWIEWSSDEEVWGGRAVRVLSDSESDVEMGEAES